MLIAIASLAVDFGRVQSVKMQLRCAADAAALAATDAIQRGNTDPTAIAIAAAADNIAAGTPVALQTGDVEYGHWNAASQKFTNSGVPVNAVHVTARRIAARGTALPLIFGSVIGQTTCNVNGDAVSIINPQIPNYAFVGIDSFAAAGLLTCDSYPALHQGAIQSNSDISLNLLGLIGLTFVDGDVRPGPGQSIIKPMIGVTNITGTTAPLSKSISYPSVDTTDYIVKNDNGSLPALTYNGTDFSTVLGAEIEAGTYLVRDLNVVAGLALKVNGPVTFYVTRNVNILAAVDLASKDPKNFKVCVANGGTVNVAAGLNMYMDLYAPDANINIGVGGNYWGAMVGKNVKILGTSFLHYDTDLAKAQLPSSSIVN